MLETLQCLINSKCREALSDIDDFDEWNADKAEARTACLLLIKYIKRTYRKYHKIKFTTEPKSPYYFMQAYIERELHPYFVIKLGEGVIPKEADPTEALKAFFKHIDVLQNPPESKRLAYMASSFHARDTDFLVTEYMEPYGSEAAIDAPEFHKNDDGSATLTYALKRDGRSVTVTRCTLHIAPDYSVKLDIQSN